MTKETIIKYDQINNIITVDCPICNSCPCKHIDMNFDNWHLKDNKDETRTTTKKNNK